MSKEFLKERFNFYNLLNCLYDNSTYNFSIVNHIISNELFKDELIKYLFIFVILHLENDINILNYIKHSNKNILDYIFFGEFSIDSTYNKSIVNDLNYFIYANISLVLQNTIQFYNELKDNYSDNYIKLEILKNIYNCFIKEGKTNRLNMNNLDGVTETLKILFLNKINLESLDEKYFKVFLYLTKTLLIRDKDINQNSHIIKMKNKFNIILGNANNILFEKIKSVFSNDTRITAKCFNELFELLDINHLNIHRIIVFKTIYELLFSDIIDTSIDSDFCIDTFNKYNELIFKNNKYSFLYAGIKELIEYYCINNEYTITRDIYFISCYLKNYDPVSGECNERGEDKLILKKYLKYKNKYLKYKI